MKSPYIQTVKNANEVMSDPCPMPGIRNFIIKLFLAGNNSGISGFPGIFDSCNKSPISVHGLCKKSTIQFMILQQVTQSATDSCNKSPNPHMILAVGFLSGIFSPNRDDF